MGGEKSNSDTTNRQNNEPIEGNINIDGLKATIDNINKQNKNFSEDTSTEKTSSDTGGAVNNCDIKSLADKVTDINRLRFELDRLQLDFKARVYFENDIRPLIDTLYIISYASVNYSTAANNIASTNFGHSSKIKDALDLAEEANKISEDLIEVIRCKIDKMLKLSKYDCK